MGNSKYYDSPEIVESEVTSDEENLPCQRKKLKRKHDSSDEHSDEDSEMSRDSCDSDESNQDKTSFKEHWVKNLPKLKVLWKANKSKNLIQCLCECSNYILQGHVKTTDLQFNRLVKHKYVLRKIARPGQNWIKSKAIIINSNSFLLPLLTTLFSCLK
jgi:hypothetical protein